MNHIAYHGPTNHSTSWGGSVLSVPSHLIEPSSRELSSETDGSITYVMYVAEMVKDCGLREWKTNSAVAVATSVHPEGPYIRQRQIIPTWAHNPQAIQIESIDTEPGIKSYVWAVYTLGDGDEQSVNGAVKDCTNSTSGTYDEGFPAEYPELADEDEYYIEMARQLRGSSENPRVDMSNTTVFFTIHYSTVSPLGPFQKYRAAIHDFPVRYDFPGNWNPSPIVLPNGSVRIMVHTNYPKMWSGGVIVEASNWKGPYRPITADVTHCVECQEDPFLWIDRRGHWHALFHRMFDPINKTNEVEEVESDDYYYFYDNYDGHPDKNKPNPIPSPGWVGGHAFSVDGKNWSNITRCFNTTVHFQDGSTVEMLRRERPKLIFDPSDPFTPTHLVNGVFEMERGTYTIVSPLNS